MRTTLLATAVAAALTLAAVEASAAPGSAATKAEIQAMQAQMEALAARLSKLEAANTALQAENSELKSVVERRDAETDYLKAQTKDLREEGAVTSNELSKLKGADWAIEDQVQGRLPHARREHRDRACGRADHGAENPEVQDAADRNRARFRARFGFDCDRDRHGQGHLPSRLGRRRSALDQPDVDQHRLGEVHLDRPGLHRLELHERRRLACSASSRIRSSGRARACSTTATSTPKARRSSSTAACSSAAPTAGGCRRTTTRVPTGNNEDANLWGLQGGMKFALFGGETEARGQLLRVRRVQGQQPVLERRQRLRQHDDQPGLGYDDDEPC